MQVLKSTSSSGGAERRGNAAEIIEAVQGAGSNKNLPAVFTPADVAQAAKQIVQWNANPRWEPTYAAYGDASALVGQISIVTWKGKSWQALTADIPAGKEPGTAAGAAYWTDVRAALEARVIANEGKIAANEARITANENKIAALPKMAQASWGSTYRIQTTMPADGFYNFIAPGVPSPSTKWFGFDWGNGQMPVEATVSIDGVAMSFSGAGSNHAITMFNTPSVTCIRTGNAFSFVRNMVMP